MTTPSHSKESYSTSSVDTAETMVGFAGDKSAVLPTTTDESAGEECLIEKTPQSNKLGAYKPGVHQSYICRLAST